MLKPPTRILAATDFSAPAQQAVKRAAQLASERQSPLHLIHVYNPLAWSNIRRLLHESSEDDPLREARHRLRVLASDLANGHAIDEVHGQLVEGRAAAGIAERARDIEAGLIVLGTRGEGLVQGLALGGTAIKVLRASPCPVLVVRCDSLQPYARILVGTDFSATSMRALRFTLDTFPDAWHVVVNAYAVGFEGRSRLGGATDKDIELYRQSEREAAQRKMQAFVIECDYRAASAVATRLRMGHATSVLEDQARLDAADLMVIGKHGLSALDERLLGSTTLNLLHHAACDVLLVP